MSDPPPNGEGSDAKSEALRRRERIFFFLLQANDVAASAVHEARQAQANTPVVDGDRIFMGRLKRALAIATSTNKPGTTEAEAATEASRLIHVAAESSASGPARLPPLPPLVNEVASKIDAPIATTHTMFPDVSKVAFSSTEEKRRRSTPTTRAHSSAESAPSKKKDVSSSDAQTNAVEEKKKVVIPEVPNTKQELDAQFEWLGENVNEKVFSMILGEFIRYRQFATTFKDSISKLKELIITHVSEDVHQKCTFDLHPDIRAATLGLDEDVAASFDGRRRRRKSRTRFSSSMFFDEEQYKEASRKLTANAKAYLEAASRAFVRETLSSLSRLRTHRGASKRFFSSELPKSPVLDTLTLQEEVRPDTRNRLLELRAQRTYELQLTRINFERRLYAEAKKQTLQKLTRRSTISQDESERFKLARMREMIRYEIANGEGAKGRQLDELSARALSMYHKASPFSAENTKGPRFKRMRMSSSASRGAQRRSEPLTVEVSDFVAFEPRLASRLEMVTNIDDMIM